MAEDREPVKIEYPKATVITACYNSLENLRQTLEALAQQDYPNIESIIVDGGSTDGCKEYALEFAERFQTIAPIRRDEKIRSNEESLGNAITQTGDETVCLRTCRVISEPDKGIFDAANKGLALATGEIIGFYWDKFASTTSLSELIETLLTSGADGVHSDLYYVGEDGTPIRTWHMGEGTIRQGWMPGHPTFYVKKWVYDAYGNYDISLKNAADYDFMVRCLAKGDVKMSYLPKVSIHMFYGGTSTSGLTAYLRSLREVVYILKKNRVRPALFVAFRRVVRTVLQFR